MDILIGAIIMLVGVIIGAAIATSVKKIEDKK